MLVLFARACYNGMPDGGLFGKEGITMAFTTADLLESLRFSRTYFLKHLRGLREEQWDWKPYPECKSIRETLIHLMQDDLVSQQFGDACEPDYSSVEREVATQVQGKDIDGILSALDAGHQALLDLLRSRYTDTPLDAEIVLWGAPLKLGQALAYLSAEDYYHAGQVAFVRMAMDPSWDYYAAVYGS